MTLKIRHGNGVPIVVNERVNDPYKAKGHSQCVLKSKLIREENLNESNNGDFRKNS